MQNAQVGILVKGKDANTAAKLGFGVGFEGKKSCEKSVNSFRHSSRDTDKSQPSAMLDESGGNER
jgi:hypothetical protein